MTVLIIGSIATAATFTGFAGFLYLLYLLTKLMRPKNVRQKEQQISSHRFYKVSGRGRAAYLILCLEAALRFYKQDLAAWEWLLRKLWTITSLSEIGWMDVWLDSVGDFLPDMVLTDSGRDTEEIHKARELYTKAGTAMIVINTILETTYVMVGEWSPSTDAHDPGALSYIDKVEETMKDFGVPLPSKAIIQPLLAEQRDSSFGKAFDGLRFSCLSKEK